LVVGTVFFIPEDTRMPVNVAQEVTALQRLTIHELRDRFAELFGEPTRAGNRTWLVKRIAWRLQALAEGDLSERARQRAAELAQDADLRVTAPRPPTAAAVPPGAKVDPRLRPGTVLTRVYKGQTLQVHVRADGFEYTGTIYSSLSAVARAITGSHWNGRLFFFGPAGPGGER
jgi:hypothetical protein